MAYLEKKKKEKFDKKQQEIAIPLLNEENDEKIVEIPKMDREKRMKRKKKKKRLLSNAAFTFKRLWHVSTSTEK